eukprot:CAMPEP_0116144656 /NCGR_PEP_ID=MMETSP0329-20121206/16127_1 /TAXON_ID=697910 /ORGANISM="Pseudo-nitzschia arenysensis, Strain B593" /LENGTH=1091 /DNA_ID=CAMNT_0003640111 /DNA_START=71 /DNA_END=3343 /DNA_ORIENTATION=-
MSIIASSSNSLSLKSTGNSSKRDRGLDDRAPEWNLNQIYGREDESRRIQDHADKLSTGTIVLQGLAGSGKSFLIESQKFEGDGWVFATGKYERRKQEPYSALIDALDSVVDQWIVNNENACICKMASFSNLLDEDMELLENILPKAFIGVKEFKSRAAECPNVSSEAKSESIPESKGKARCDAAAINAAFWRVLSFICQAKPVVLFLDDIHWADQASLDAIQVLATAGNIEGFLLILSYREEEVKEDDPTRRCLDFIDKECEHVEKIHVTDLNVEDTNKMVSSLLEQESERTMELTKVIHGKTAGNPFFVVQFIQMLRHESFISYNFHTLEWEWGNVHKMDQLAFVSDNVADVVALSISKLPHGCLIAIQKASCLGKVIPMQVMIEYFRKCEVGDNLCDSLICIREDGLRKIFQDAVEFQILKRLDDNTFMWAHDKLQHVAYSMIPKSYVQETHKVLGMILWEMHNANPENEWMLYMAADQLNHVTDVSDDGLREDIARLSFEAGQLSISKSAFFPALDMLRFAAKHLGNMENSWETTYELSLEVYSTLAQLSIRFLTYEEGLDAATRVDEHAKLLEDKLRAQIVFIRHKVEGENRDYEGAVKSIQNMLLDYGVKIPTTIIPGQQFLENRKLKARLGGGAQTFLTIRKLDEQNVHDKRICNILSLLAHLLEYSFYHKKLNSLNSYATLRILNISLQEGASSDTALAIAHFSGLLGKNGHNEESREWSDVAVKLVDSFPRTIGSRHSNVHTWTVYGISTGYPLHKMLEPILELNRLAMRYGDITQGSMAWVGYSYAYLSIGLPLDPLDSDIMSFSNEARPFGVAATIRVLFPILRQAINNLKTLHANPTLLKGDIFDQEKDLKKFKDGGLTMTLRDINSLRLMLACIYRDWATAEKLITALEPFLHTDRWFLRRNVCLTYVGYASITLGKIRTNLKRKKFRKLGKNIIKIYKGILKDGASDAFPILMMLEAIESPSKKRFDEAIRTAARSGLVHQAAILYENAGLCFMEKGNTGWAEYYLSEATKLYGEWGAHGKATQMFERYEFLRRSSLAQKNGGNIQGRTRFSSEPLHQFREPVTSSLAQVAYEEKEDW